MKIGLRIPWTIAREIPLNSFATWCHQHGFGAIDLSERSVEASTTLHNVGIELGTVDIAGTTDLLSPDPAEREKGIAAVVESLKAIYEMGGNKAFCVFFPRNDRQSRKESFENWKQSFPVAVAEAERLGIRFAVEGWPGPNNSALAVTPETIRAMFAAVPSENFGLNYDPSHLVRVGVDYKRFLDEFAGRVVHAHGKDTSKNAEGLYHYGNLGTTFDSVPAFGGGDWRYCIPGEGDIDWSWVCARLHRAGFDGIVSIELEDFRYNGSEDGERRGLLRAKDHLVRFL